MLYFIPQQKLDFEQPDWTKDPQLYVIHQILNDRPDIFKLVKPCFPNLKNKKIGRTGITLEQVVRCAIYLKIKRLKYRELSLHTADSKLCIAFTKMDYGQSFSSSTLQEVISKITPEVLEKIIVEIGKIALELGIDTGEKLRTDSTAIEQLESTAFTDEEMEKKRQKFLTELIDLFPKMDKIYNAAYRKEILGEQVSVNEKLFSIFEDHTDCIVKGQRDVIFGHKVNFTTGKSGLIFDTIIEKGNPADVDFYGKTLANVKENYSLVPRDFATDGGYASSENLSDAKERGIVNIVFTKVKGKLQNQSSSKKMETMLKKWRSGIEANISNFKRGLNVARAIWKGFEGFETYVLWSVIAYNFKMLASLILKQ